MTDKGVLFSLLSYVDVSFKVFPNLLCKEHIIFFSEEFYFSSVQDPHWMKVFSDCHSDVILIHYMKDFCNIKEQIIHSPPPTKSVQKYTDL